MNIHDALARFIRQLEGDGRSPHTTAQYRRHLEQFATWAAQHALDEDVRSIDHEALAEFLAAPCATRCADGRPRKAATVNALRSSLRGLFGYLHKAGVLEEDPSRLVRSAICGPPLPRTLSDADQKRLLAVLAGAAKEGDDGARRDHALFGLLLATGVRLSAALALEVLDVDLDAGELAVRHSKGGRAERVFLPPAIQRHLRGFLADRREGPLFVNPDGARISARHARRRLTHWLKKAGARPAAPHALRHSFAMSLYRRTRDILVVRRALGHRSLSSTLHYAQAQDDDLRAAMGLGG